MTTLRAYKNGRFATTAKGRGSTALSCQLNARHSVAGPARVKPSASGRPRQVALEQQDDRVHELLGRTMTAEVGGGRLAPGDLDHAAAEDPAGRG